MNAKRIWMLLCVLVFVLLVCIACNAPNDSEESNIISEHTDGMLEGDDVNYEGGCEVNNPVYLPLPYSRAFVEETVPYDEYMFLHDMAVNYYSARIDAEEGALLLLSLRVIDEWQPDTGGKYYLCYMATHDYYDISERLVSGTARDMISGESVDFYGGRLIRFQVSKADTECVTRNYWGYQLEEILEFPESGEVETAIQELCEGREVEEILYAAEQGEISKKDVIGKRYVLPEEYAINSGAMLEKYLDVYFPESK